MFIDIISENSDKISEYNESRNKQNDNLNINKIKETSGKESNNKSEIIQNKKKMLPLEKSINHISLYIKNSVDGNLTEKKSVLSKSDKQSESKSNNSSGSNRIRFFNIDSNNNFFSNIRRSFHSENENYSSYNNSSMEINDNCLICEEKLTEEEKKDNLLKCNHIFCNDCYFEYLKEKVNSNQIDIIKCPQKDCQIILKNNFIQKKLFNDTNLLEKYVILEKRRQLMLDPDIQLCPYPDCESYAKKVKNNNYVCCVEKKHKFCFNCLKEWHGKKKCDDSVDESFKKWRDSYKVKRCPKCKIFIEKNEGCNHITCKNCSYEFCWLCMSKYSSNHFDFGRCAGLQNVECQICSNRIINFLYSFLLIILKSVAFAICAPFVLTFYIYYQFHYKCLNKYSDCIVLYAFYGTLSCLNFIMCGLCLSSFISVLMIFIWPFHEWVFSIICY